MKKSIFQSGRSLWIIFALTLAAYFNIFQNEFILDDHDYIENWPLIQDLKNLPQFFWKYVPPVGQEGIYSPIKTLIHSINFQLVGMYPPGHHAISLLNYFLLIFLVYRISLFFVSDRLVGFIATLMFALHPVHNEYVASITGSVDAVGITFMFAAFLFYLRANVNPLQVDRKNYFISIMFSFLAIFTHELVLSLPFLFLWYSFCFHRKNLSFTKMISRVLPFFLIGFGYVLLKRIVLGSISRGQYIYDSFNLTMLVIVKAVAKYVGIFLFPVVLTHNHIISDGIFSFSQEDFNRFAVLSQSWIDLPVIFSLFVIGGLIYIAVRSYKKDPFIAFCIGWFFISLLPVLNIVPSSIYFAERYLFPGSLMACLLVVRVLYEVLVKKEVMKKKAWMVLIVVLLIVIAGLAMLRIWTRNKDLHDDISLFKSAVKANPQSALMQTDLGIIYLRNNQYELATESLKNALKLRSDDPEIYFSLAEVYVNTKRYYDAVDALHHALLIKPDYAEAYYNLAGIYANFGLKDKANEFLEKSLKLMRLQGKQTDANEYEKAYHDYFDHPRPPPLSKKEVEEEIRKLIGYPEP